MLLTGSISRWENYIERRGCHPLVTAFTFSLIFCSRRLWFARVANASLCLTRRKQIKLTTQMSSMNLE